MPSTSPHMLYGDLTGQSSPNHSRSAARPQYLPPLLGQGSAPPPPATDNGPSSHWNASRAYYGGLEASDAFASHGSSPQSSNGSLLCTPYQTGIHLAEVHSPVYIPQHHDVGLMEPSSPFNSLGLELMTLRKSPLGAQSHWGPSLGMGQVPTQDTVQDARSHHETHLTYTQIRAGDITSPGIFNAHLPSQSRTSSHSRSHSYGRFIPDLSVRSRAPEITFSQLGISSTHNRSLSLPAFEESRSPYAPNSDYYPASEVPIQPFLPTTSVSIPPPFGAEDALTDNLPLYKVERVGSDRTRAVSQQRRTNTSKKLYVCNIPGCGATITSSHNFKSHMNSHKGVKPYPCGQGDCDKTFGTRAEAKRHQVKYCRNNRPGPQSDDANE